MWIGIQMLPLNIFAFLVTLCVVVCALDVVVGNLEIVNPQWINIAGSGDQIPLQDGPNPKKYIAVLQRPS